MRILIAPDKFKGTLDAQAVCKAVAAGWCRAIPDTTCISMPMADGGEGTLEILTDFAKGTFQKTWVYDPLFRWVKAKWGYEEQSQIAFIEMARASGLYLLDPDEQNGYYTTTYGTGQLIKAAMEAGAQKLIIGVGGSATCDGGIGMAAALGVRLLDNQGAEVLPIGANLNTLAQIVIPKTLQMQLDQLEIVVVSDVDNTLWGEKGAAKVYGPQKGIEVSQIDELDDGLKNLGDLLDDLTGKNIANQSGAGAAGGLGAGLMGFLGASVEPGAAYIADWMGLHDHLNKIDYIITGEGKMDEQTLHGKVVHYICDQAKPYNVPVLGICGTLDLDLDQQDRLGLKYATSILPRPIDLLEAKPHTYNYIYHTSFNMANLVSLKALR